MAWRRESKVVRAFQIAQILVGLTVSVAGTWLAVAGFPPTLNWGLVAQGCAILAAGLITTIRGIGARGTAIDAVRNWYDERREYIDAYHAGRVPEIGTAADRIRSDLLKAQRDAGRNAIDQESGGSNPHAET